MSEWVATLLKDLDRRELEGFGSSCDPAAGGAGETEAGYTDPKLQLERMIREYAERCGITNALAWQDFDRAYYGAYRANLSILRRRYCERAGLATINRAAYFEAVHGLDDALHIAGKLLARTRY